jgi:hypothetical protein
MKSEVVEVSFFQRFYDIFIANACSKNGFIWRFCLWSLSLIEKLGDVEASAELFGRFVERLSADSAIPLAELLIQEFRGSNEENQLAIAMFLDAVFRNFPACQLLPASLDTFRRVDQTQHKNPITAVYIQSLVVLAQGDSKGLTKAVVEQSKMENWPN